MNASGGEQQHEWVVDSIDEGMASVEVDGGRTITVPLSTLPRGTREGQVLRVSRERSADGTRSTLVIELDPAATQRALEASAQQVAKTARQPNDPGGDIAL